MNYFKCAVAFFFLFFLHETSIVNGQQGISYNGTWLCVRCFCAVDLRHSCLTQLIKDGNDLRSVQKLAGHKNINTTANYIKIIDLDVIKITSPLSKIKI